MLLPIIYIFLPYLTILLLYNFLYILYHFLYILGFFWVHLSTCIYLSVHLFVGAEITMPFVLSLWADYNVQQCKEIALSEGRNVTFGNLNVDNCTLPIGVGSQNRTYLNYYGLVGYVNYSKSQNILLKSLISIKINVVPTPDTNYTEKCTVLINAAIVFLAY